MTKKITGLEELELDQQLSEEAKSIVVLAFRNGPIEDVHAGKECPTCSGNSEYSHITQEEMKRIMKRAVDKVYALLWIRDHHPDVFRHVVNAGNAFTTGWDAPEHRRETIEFMVRTAELFSSGGRSDSTEMKSKAKPRRRKRPNRETESFTRK